MNFYIILAIYSIKNNKLNLFKKIVDSYPEIVNFENSIKITIHYFTIIYNQPIFLRYLILKGGDINKEDNYGRTLLYLSSYHNSLQCLKILLNYDADICAGSKKFRPLHICCLKGYHESLKELLKKNKEINKKNFADMTPLHLAVMSNSKECVDLLLKNNANIEMFDIFYTTPLLISCFENHSECLYKLLLKDANLNIKMKNGNTPLHIACAHNSLNCVKLLVFNNVNLNELNNDDYTPTFIACKKGYTKILIFLLIHGAKIRMSSLKYGNPLFYIMNNKFREINAIFKIFNKFQSNNYIQNMNLKDIENKLKKKIINNKKKYFLGKNSLQKLCRFKVKEIIIKKNGYKNYTNIINSLYVPYSVKRKLLLTPNIYK